MTQKPAISGSQTLLVFPSTRLQSGKAIMFPAINERDMRIKRAFIDVNIVCDQKFRWPMTGSLSMSCDHLPLTLHTPDHDQNQRNHHRRGDRADVENVDIGQNGRLRLNELAEQADRPVVRRAR